MVMTLDEARAHPGAEVTHHASGVIELVTAQFVWVRYDGAAAAQPVHPDELTLGESAESGPVVSYLVHMDGEDYCFDPADVTIVRRAAEPADGAG